MNYTITFSPSIDYIIDNNKNTFNPKNLTRVENYYLYPGGKGINASIIMNEIGVNNSAIFFSYGKTAELYDSLLSENKIKNFEKINIKNDLDLRINIKYFDLKNKFEINGPSPKILSKEFDLLKKKLNDLNEKDIVFIMGKCDETILIDLIEFIVSKKSKFVIDIDSKILLKILKYKPLAIKPNIDELELILGKKISSNKDVVKEMQELKKMGAYNVIVSMGDKGSILLDEDNKTYLATFDPLKEIKSTVGCGDTLLSSYVGFKYNKNLSSIESVKSATAMAMSTASNWFLGNKSQMEQFIKKVDVKEI